MLTSLGLGAPEAKPDPTKPMCAVSNDDQQLGVIKGHSIRVKYVIPARFQAQVAAKELWIGAYKHGDGLAVAVVRPAKLEGFAVFDSSVMEVGAWYVMSLKFGEVWPLITTHCTTSRFFVVEPVVHEPAPAPVVARERPAPPRSIPALVETETDPFDTPPLPRRSLSQSSMRRSRDPSAPAPVPSAVTEGRRQLPTRGSNERVAASSPSGSSLSPRRSGNVTPPLGTARPPPARRTNAASSAEPAAARPPPARPAPTPESLGASADGLPSVKRRGSAPTPVVRREQASPAPVPPAGPAPGRAVPGLALGAVRPSLGSPAPARYSEATSSSESSAKTSPRKSAGNRPPARPSAGRRRRLVRCLEAHVPRDPTSEIGTTEGEIVELILDMGNGWLRVKRTQDDTSGLIPGDSVEHL